MDDSLKDISGQKQMRLVEMRGQRPSAARVNTKGSEDENVAWKRYETSQPATRKVTESVPRTGLDFGHARVASALCGVGRRLLLLALA